MASAGAVATLETGFDTAVASFKTEPTVKTVSLKSELVSKTYKTDLSVEYQDFKTELPIELVSYILSHLSVHDKLNAVCALPQWEDALLCSPTWNNVAFDFGKSPIERDELHTILDCLLKYGSHFPRLKVSFPNATRASDQYQIMQQVCLSCCSLRSLELTLPSFWGPAHKDRLVVYASTLREISNNNKDLNSIALSFMNYEPVDSSVGVDEMFKEILLPDSTLCESLDRVAFSHRYPLAKPVSDLVPCANLRKLGCQIQSLNTETIEALLRNTKLEDLHVTNDEYTHECDWNERAHINWAALHLWFPHRHLRVHYTVKNRTWVVEHLVVNPFMHTLVLDCQHLDSFLATLGECAILYAASLRVFMVLASNEQSPFFDIEDELSCLPALCGALVHNCRFLHTFVAAIPIPAAAILTIAANKKVENICVLEECVVYDHVDIPRSSLWQVDEDIRVDWWRRIVNDRASLVNIVSKFAGYAWKPLTTEQLLEKVHKLLDVF